MHERPEDDEKLDMVQDEAQEIADNIFTRFKYFPDSAGLAIGGHLRSDV